MGIKMTLWFCALMFTATIYNVVSAYSAMGDINVHDKFQEIGILYSAEKEAFPLPVRKPLQVQQLAYKD